jgi:large subunit ribosomal protein L4
MAVKATVLGGSAKDHALDAAVFEAEVKPHLVHETVRAELNAARRGTRGAKSRGLVSGGRSKPWRQKGTGRARQGTIRAPQFAGGGVAFPPGMRSFDVKVNRKARKAALRGALSSHAANGSLALLDGSSFDAPSTKQAKGVLADWGKDAPVLVVAHADEEAVVKSFRNLERVLVTVPEELEVAAVVWARALLVTQILLAPVVSEKSYAGIADGRYTFKVHPEAHRTQVRQAVEQLFGVHVERVNIVKVQAKPKRRGLFKGTRPGWKKAIVQVREGEAIEIFEGAQV